MKSLELSSMSDEELNALVLEDKTFGVIGVCGVVGNLVARILMDHGYAVVGTDISSKEDCRFYSSFADYDIEIFFGGHPEEFFSKIDYIVPPPSMGENAKVLQLAREKGIKIIHLGDIFKLFAPEKPVLCISGTNGKTTTTTLLKHIAYSNGIKPSEHNLEGMQGNNEFIPSLQTRLNGDLAILETGTDGTPGGLKSVADLTHANYAILTNITVDHLVNPDEDEDSSLHTNSFLSYARVKGELVEGIDENGGTLIYNSDDPTIVGLLRELGYSSNSISFGLDYEYVSKNSLHEESITYKECFCGRKIEVNEIISGSGIYSCECGIGYKKPYYLATNIDLKNRTFTLVAKEYSREFTLSIDGLHNIYNALGAIIAAKVFLKLSDDDIQKALSTFAGTDGRMDIVGSIGKKTIMVDYAHNPAGVEAVLDAVSSIYGDVALVVTVSSESGFEGDIDIIESTQGYAKYIVPASHDSDYAICQLVNYLDGNLNQLSDEEIDAIESSKNLNISKESFVFVDGDLEQKSIRTLGADKDQVLIGLKTALNLEADIVLIIGEAAFKFKDSVIDFIEKY